MFVPTDGKKFHFFSQTEPTSFAMWSPFGYLHQEHLLFLKASVHDVD